MVKRILIIILLVLVAKSALAEELPDTPGNRQAAAERYVAEVSLEQMYADAVKKMSMNLPKAKRKEFVDITLRGIRWDVLERATIVSMTNHFTLREINALAAFYGSGEGRSIMIKIDDYMADVMLVLEQELERSVQEYMKTQQR